jgi:hypothetical protein
MKLGKKPAQYELLDALGSEAVVQDETPAYATPLAVEEPETPDVDVLEKVEQKG